MKFINADIVIRNGLIPLQTYTGEVLLKNENIKDYITTIRKSDKRKRVYI